MTPPTLEASEAAFWQILAAARETGGDDADAVTNAVVAHLSLRPLAEIDSFGDTLDRLLDVAYTWPLWAAAYIINGGCSDDGFEYFRCWLISRGPDIFHAAVRDPDTLADIVDGEVEWEPLLYSAMNAREAHAEAPERPRYGRHPTTPSGSRWREEDLPTLLPRLWAACS